MSDLCTKICLYSHKYESQNPQLMSLSKRATVRSKQLETEDPLVIQLAKKNGEDMEYIEMLNAIENDTKNLPADCKLK